MARKAGFNLTEATLDGQRVYTVGEANGTLPWLVTRLEQIKASRKELEAADVARRTMVRMSRNRDSREYASRIREAEDVLRDGQAALRQLVNEVIDRDIQLRDLDTGLVDFPGQREGRDVWLCWRLGEPAVEYWHEVDRGYSHRKPL